MADVLLSQSLHQPMTRLPRSEQKSFLGPENPSSIEVPDPMSPELKMPKLVQWDTSHHLNRVNNVDHLKKKDGGLVVGGVKPTERDDEVKNQIAEPELAVAKPTVATQGLKSTHQERTMTTIQGTFVNRQYTIITDPVDSCRILSSTDLVKQRVALSASIGLVDARYNRSR